MVATDTGYLVGRKLGGGINLTILLLEDCEGVRGAFFFFLI